MWPSLHHPWLGHPERELSDCKETCLPLFPPHPTPAPRQVSTQVMGTVTSTSLGHAQQTWLRWRPPPTWACPGAGRSESMMPRCAWGAAAIQVRGSGRGGLRNNPVAVGVGLGGWTLSPTSLHPRPPSLPHSPSCPMPQVTWVFWGEEQSRGEGGGTGTSIGLMVVTSQSIVWSFWSNSASSQMALVHTLGNPSSTTMWPLEGTAPRNTLHTMQRCHKHWLTD